MIVLNPSHGTGLSKEHLATKLVSLRNVRPPFGSCQNHHENCLQVWIFLDVPQHFQSTHLGKIQLQQDQAGRGVSAGGVKHRATDSAH
jgi:hypothetical protein